MIPKGTDVIILGRFLGTANGWDGEPGEVMWFYDFDPAAGVPLRSGFQLTFEEKAGWLSLSDDNDNVVGEKLDVVAFLATIPRRTP